ncbi:MAG TPA: hypothetical protein VJH20_00245 [Candidatus Nanoarchaeia archaeon]|nr:hypothetical protein [Candidatus Nanoarchaeia archaeon]
MPLQDKDIKEILEKYKTKLKKSLKYEEDVDPDFSKEYNIFREQYLSKGLSLYEKLCNIFESVLRVRPKDLDYKKLDNSIKFTHLNITPIGAASFGALSGAIIVLIAVLYTIFIFFTNDIPKEEIYSYLFAPLIIVLVGLISVKPITNLPHRIAATYRLKASNQMVLCVLYMVMYMRHTSNLEHAIKFAASHIQDPLSLDLRKIFWDVETEKFTNIKESLDNYLEGWREHNLEFVNSFHLIVSSLYEPNEDRRLTLLDKALDVILNGTYERMLHYAHGLKNPIQILHMLGVVLSILSLIMFPLVGSFLGGAIKWGHLFVIYDILLPLVIFVIGVNLLNKRPTGYGESSLGFKMSKGGIAFAASIGIVIIFFGLSPLIMHWLSPDFDINFGPFGSLLDYKCEGDVCFGPYGVGAVLISLLVPIGLAFGVGIYYRQKTKDLIKIRNETAKLEAEFSGSLFQLGNRIGDGIPAELAFDKVAENMRGTPTGNFFNTVSNNINTLGMSMEQAIFNLDNGAILNYPSPLVESSMEVLVESAKKGPYVVSNSLISISNYVNQVHNINERLKDLLGEIISSMKSMTNFLAPIIAGIVVGMASLMVSIIGRLGDLFANSSSDQELFSTGGSEVFGVLINIKEVIPSYFFQIIIGVYIVEIIFILSVLSNGIENGPDKIGGEHLIGRNMFTGTLLYSLIAFLFILVFNALVIVIMQGIAT